MKSCQNKKCKKRRLRLLLLFLLLGSIPIGSFAQGEKIRLNVRDVTIRQFFEKIEVESEYRFTYRDVSVDEKARITYTTEGEAIESVLQKTLTPLGLQFKTSQKDILISRKTPAQKTAKTFYGQITDANNEPVIGASIRVKDSQTGTITDMEGKFSVEAAAGSVLQISYIGYRPKEITVSEKTDLKIELSEDENVLNEVVVIGYGERKKKDITTSISSISSDKIMNTVAMTPEMAMQGQMSGIHVQGNIGDPFSRPTLRVRGVNTWGVTDPIYVIDGIPIKEYGAGIEGDDYGYSRGVINIMSLIDPNDIESISVLKDAAAAAIYGVRASNGVILITTKKGRKEQKPSVTFNSKLSVFNQRQRLDVMNTQEYTAFYRKLVETDPNWENNIQMNDWMAFYPEGGDSYLGESPTYDWQSAGVRENALSQDYSVRIAGGTAKSDYSVSFGYADHDGTRIGTWLKRYSTAFNLNTDINEYIRSGVNFRLSNGAGDAQDYWVRSIMERAAMPPWQPIYDPNGRNGYAQAVTGYKPNGKWDSNVLYGSMTRNNFLGILSMLSGQHETTRLMGSVYLEIEPVKGLILKGIASLDNINVVSNPFSQYDNSLFQYQGPDPTGQPKGSAGSYEDRRSTNNNIVFDLSANYVHTFGKHNFDVMLDGMFQKYSMNAVFSGTSYITTTNPSLVGLGGSNEYTFNSGGRNRGKLLGSFLRIAYNWDSRYYLEGTVRRDASSRFAPEKRWGTFPGISAAWRISSESFLEDVKWIDDVKLRASWGSLGNQEVSDMAWLSGLNFMPNYSIGHDPSNIGLGYRYSAAAAYGMANRGLTWEKTTTSNAGIDFSLFNGLDGSFEYYHKMTDGILQNVTLPLSVGVLHQPVDNIAQVRNTGFEVSLNYRKQTGKVHFSVGGNLTTVKNRVMKMYEGVPIGAIEEGYSMNYIKGFIKEGTFQSREEALAFMDKYTDIYYRAPLIQGGDFYFKDLRGAPTAEDIANGVNLFYSPAPDGIIDNYDMVCIGKTIPGYFYGAHLSADYAGIDFSMQFTGVGDVQKINSVKQQFLNVSSMSPINRIRAVENYWREDNTDTDMPRLRAGDPANSGRFSTYYVEDGDYLRCSNIQLGYTLPQAVYRATGDILNNARFFAGCQNSFTFTKFGGLDPEDDGNPAPFVVYTGFSLKF